MSGYFIISWGGARDFCIDVVGMLGGGDSLEPTQHPRYAAGRMMSKVHLCRIFATAFYTPGVLEVIEALAMPTNRQQEGMLWLVPVPFNFIGMTFGQVFKQLNTVRTHTGEASLV